MVEMGYNPREVFIVFLGKSHLETGMSWPTGNQQRRLVMNVILIGDSLSLFQRHGRRMEAVIDIQMESTGGCIAFKRLTRVFSHMPAIVVVHKYSAGICICSSFKVSEDYM